MQAYLVKMVTHLIAERHFTLTALVRARFQLAQALTKEIERLRQLAMAKGFQGRLIDMAVPGIEQLAHYSFHYQAGQYPARQIYQGSYEFNKHFYPMIHDLREKTQAGQVAEEFRCAQAIDAHPRSSSGCATLSGKSGFRSGCHIYGLLLPGLCGRVG